MVFPRSTAPTPLVRRSAVAGAATVLAAVTLAPAGSAQASTYPLGTTKQVSGPLTTGALFASGLGGQHTCSGTVVAAKGGAVVLTAAHCIHGTAKGWQFVPGYRNGSMPAGAWTVEAAYVDPRWKGGVGDRYDVAVLRMAPKWINGANRSINYLTSAAILRNAPASGTVVDITGWGIGRNDTARTCSNRLTAIGWSAYTSCSYLPGGVSGSGLRFGSDGRGHQYVGAVLGGYKQGGCQDWDAYAVRVDSWVTTLVSRAEAKQGGNTVPYPIWNGCTTGR